jgi:hypothetical protein
MGLDVNPHLIVGIRLDEIVEYKDESVTYELHDTRTGKKTGKTETEKKRFMICGDRKIEIGERLYIDNLCYGEDALLQGVEDYPSNSDTLGLFDINYDSEADYILGFSLLKVNAMQGENGELDFKYLLAKKEELRIILEAKFGYKGEITLFLDDGAGY